MVTVWSIKVNWPRGLSKLIMSEKAADEKQTSRPNGRSEDNGEGWVGGLEVEKRECVASLYHDCGLWGIGDGGVHQLNMIERKQRRSEGRRLKETSRMKMKRG